MPEWLCSVSEAVPRRRVLEWHHQDFGRVMIRNENEYKDAVRRLGEQEERLMQPALGGPGWRL